MYRKMKYGDEDEFEADQTEVVAEDMVAKAVPEINTNAVAPLPAPMPAPVPAPVAPMPKPAAPAAQLDPRGIAPLPPTGLPEGWTQEQWNHFGWQYIDGFSMK